MVKRTLFILALLTAFSSLTQADEASDYPVMDVDFPIPSPTNNYLSPTTTSSSITAKHRTPSLDSSAPNLSTVVPLVTTIGNHELVLVHVLTWEKLLLNVPNLSSWTNSFFQNR